MEKHTRYNKRTRITPLERRLINYGKLIGPVMLLMESTFVSRRSSATATVIANMTHSWFERLIAGVI